MSDAYYLIEGGKPLELVKNHIKEVQRVHQENVSMARELGVSQIVADGITGVLRMVVFPGGKAPEGWSKPDRRGASRPKDGTAWAQRLAQQRGHESASKIIVTHLGVPTHLETVSPNGTRGWEAIGSPFVDSEFLWLSEDAPYGMLIPDVQAEVQAREKQGYTVAEPAKSFSMTIEGCRRIEVEEWDLLVAQHNLKEKMAATELQPADAAAG